MTISIAKPPTLHICWRRLNLTVNLHQTLPIRDLQPFALPYENLTRIRTKRSNASELSVILHDCFFRG